MVANCVPGNMMDIVGKPGMYTVVLKVLMPALYGDLKLMAVGHAGPCNAAANAVNNNNVPWSDVKTEVLERFSDMKELGVLHALGDADNTSSYLYIFENLLFKDYELIADAVPGSIVYGLELTSGKIALYTIALQVILPSLLGDLQYLGTGPTSDCEEAMNKINGGNHTFYELLKSKQAGYSITEVGILKGLAEADNTTGYLYVFKNKLWNATWDVMTGDGAASFSTSDRRLIA